MFVPSLYSFKLSLEQWCQYIGLFQTNHLNIFTTLHNWTLRNHRWIWPLGLNAAVFTWIRSGGIKNGESETSFLLSSSSSIVCVSASVCLRAAEANVMETKGGLGINSALTSSFRILSHAKRQAAHRAEGDADNYSLTLRHRWRLTLQTDWQMKELK